MKNKNQTKFKETEIGTIPEEWDVLELEKFAELVKDTYLPNKSEELSYVGLEHIDQQTLSLNSIGKSSDVKSNKFSFKNGDILFGKLRPYFRKVYRPKFSGICSTDIWVARAKEGFEQGWLFYLFASEDFINFASGGSGGTRMPRADWHHLKDIVWPIPKLNEQKQIAEILSSLDDKIELNWQINANLEKIASSLFKHWFVEFEFPDKNGKPYKSSGGKMIDSELGEIPEGWKVEPISSFGNVVCGKTPSKYIKEYFDGKMPFIKIPDMHGNIFVIKTIDGLTVDGMDSQKNKTIPSGSICVSCIATVGLVSMTIKDSQTNQQINSIIPAKNIYQFYLYYAMKNLEGVLQRMGSSGSATLNVNTKSFSSINILSPDNTILGLFDDTIRPIFDQIKLNMKESLALSQIRDSLLPRLMNGKIRVKNQ